MPTERVRVEADTGTHETGSLAGTGFDVQQASHMSQYFARKRSFACHNRGGDAKLPPAPPHPGAISL
jgi:hypothetical protein